MARIISNRNIAPGYYRMRISCPDLAARPKPGQFVMVRVGSSIEPLLRRPFAAFRFKTLEGFRLEIYYQVVGHGTRIMSQMLPETDLELLGPLGNGFKSFAKLNSALIVAGGMGIAPLRGLIFHLLESKVKDIHIFLGAKSFSQLLFQSEFTRREIPLHLATEDGSSGHHGLITVVFQQFLENHSLSVETRKMCFACGPRAMLAKVSNLCSQHHLPCQVSLESHMACGLGVCLGCAVKRKNKKGSRDKDYQRVCLEGPVFNAEVIEW